MNLYSRTERIGGPGCYRDVVIHEVTDGELRMMRAGKFMWFVLGAISGFLFAAWNFYPLIAAVHN